MGVTNYKLGILTPSHSRHRYIGPVVRQALAQTWHHWVMCYVQDGPDTKARDLFHLAAGRDARLHYRETPTWNRDFGVSPRLAGLEWMQQLPEPPTHVVMWDDDNVFYPGALASIARELDRLGDPDVLIVPMHYHRRILPDPATRTGREVASLDTSNMVVRLPLAQAGYTATKAGGVTFGEDFTTFQHIVRDPDLRVELATCEPIGRYDGMRPLVTLRWKLGIPPLNISRTNWWRPIRRRLRK